MLLVLFNFGTAITPCSTRDGLRMFHLRFKRVATPAFPALFSAFRKVPLWDRRVLCSVCLTDLHRHIS